MPSAVGHLRIDGCMLAAAILETLLIGIYYCLLAGTIEALIERARERKERFLRPISVVAAVLSLTISSHWILDIVTAFDAFIRPHDLRFCHEPDTFTLAEETYLDLTDWKQVANSALYVTTTVVGDSFMAYRLYIVWERNKWIVIPPTVLCLALVGTGAMVTYFFSQAAQPIFKAAGPWITASFILTFLCNIYSTGLIAIRIFISDRKLRSLTTTFYDLGRVRKILIEAAVWYSICVIISLGAHVGNSNIQFTCVAVNSPVIGIIFCMITTRAHRPNRDEEQCLQSQTQPLQFDTDTEVSWSMRVATPISPHIEATPRDRQI